VDKALAALKVYEVGKPLVIEEMFPLSCTIEELEAFIAGSREFTDGWISFYWGATIAENRDKGTLSGAVVAQWLQRFQDLSPSRAPDDAEATQRD
jgi:hypothetical protein